MTALLFPGEVPVKHLVAAGSLFEVVSAPTVPLPALDLSPLGGSVEAVGRVWPGDAYGATIGYWLAREWAGRPAAVEPSTGDLVGWPGLDGDQTASTGIEHETRES